ncbi:MAG TPA: hypothetical protein VLE93_00735 [Candidatus Saccharimonadales bacterium]|nr:hypothetical protein [Candidatus Saccharimonadales bacterium]
MEDKKMCDCSGCAVHEENAGPEAMCTCPVGEKECNCDMCLPKRAAA